MWTYVSYFQYQIYRPKMHFSIILPTCFISFESWSDRTDRQTWHKNKCEISSQTRTNCFIKLYSSLKKRSDKERSEKNSSARKYDYKIIFKHSLRVKLLLNPIGLKVHYCPRLNFTKKLNYLLSFVSN